MIEHGALYLLDGQLVLQVWHLIGIGLLGGLVAGLVGIGGGVVVVPAMIALGVPPWLASATMSVAIVANSSGALVYNLRRGGIEWRLGLWMGAAAVLGGQLATLWISDVSLRGLDKIITIGFALLLLGVSVRFLRSKHRDTVGNPHRLLTELPLRWHSKLCGTEISGLLPAAAALFIGMLAALLGVGGGVFFIPLVLWLTHASIKSVIPVNQITVFLTALSVSSGHVLHTGHVEANVALVLILSGAVGTAIGSRLKQRVSADQVRRVFGIVLLAGGGRMLWQSLQGNSAVGLQPVALGSDAGTWLRTVGLALVLGPLLAVIQHWVYERIPGSAAGEQDKSDTN